MGTGLPSCRNPAVRQQLFEPFDRMVSDPPEDIAEPGKGIDLRQFAGGDKAAQDRRGPASVVAPEESPVVPPDREAAQRALSAVVIDGQIAVAAIARQRRPVLQSI